MSGKLKAAAEEGETVVADNEPLYHQSEKEEKKEKAEKEIKEKETKEEQEIEQKEKTVRVKDVKEVNDEVEKRSVVKKSETMEESNKKSEKKKESEKQPIREESKVEKEKAHIATKQCRRCLTKVDMRTPCRCSSCKCVYYCSQQCQTTDWENHKELCTVIKDLSEESQENAKQARIFSAVPETVAKLVGRKCIVNCIMNKKKINCLYDTGAQVSLISEELLEVNKMNVEIREIKELLEGEESLEVQSASNTEIPYEGYVMLNKH